MAKYFTPSRLSENIRETPEGYLLCIGVPIARTGWQEYGPGETPLEVGEEGTVWIYRSPEEVFRAQTVASFNGKSVTIRHPNDFVDPKNWKMLTHGVAQNVRKGDEKDEDDEEQLLADLLITDDFAIGLVKNGLREVSCGYDAEYEQTGDGEGKQINIIGNHIALVEQGRAGSAYAIKDHKGETDMKEKLKALAETIKNLGKTVDEAIAADDDAKAKLAAKKAKKAKDAKTDDDAPEQVCYDDVMKAIKDVGEKVAALQAKKEDKDSEDEEQEEESEDEENPVNSAEAETSERVKKLEAAVAKILKLLGNKNAEDEEESEEDMSGEDEGMEESEDEESEEAEDADGDEGEEGENSQKKTGDAANFEILTPGKKYEGKDARVKCLKAFAKTEDGAKVLAQLGMKKPVFDAKANHDTTFLAAVALVKSSRGNGLQGTKDGKKWKAEDVDNTSSSGMTAEQMNELNAKHYGVSAK